MGYELLHIYKSFQGKPVLTDVSLAMPEYGAVALFGPSGCGKTTLAHILLGLINPDGGSAPVPGEVLAAAVFQEDRLITGMSAKDNVAMVLRGTRHERLAAAETRLDALGLDGGSGKPVRELSGGMRRRVALARALAMEPKRLLVLDEPFNGLDTRARSVALEHIAEASRHMAVLLISHDRSDAKTLGAEIVELG